MDGVGDKLDRRNAGKRSLTISSRRRTNSTKVGGEALQKIETLGKITRTHLRAGSRFVEARVPSRLATQAPAGQRRAVRQAIPRSISKIC